MTEELREVDIPQLMKFYSVDNLLGLIARQAEHIEKLQAKLPHSPDAQPRKAREG